MKVVENFLICKFGSVDFWYIIHSKKLRNLQKEVQRSISFNVWGFYCTTKLWYIYYFKLFVFIHFYQTWQCSLHLVWSIKLAMQSKKIIGLNMIDSVGSRFWYLRSSFFFFFNVSRLTTRACKTSRCRSASWTTTPTPPTTPSARYTSTWTRCFCRALRATRGSWRAILPLVKTVRAFFHDQSCNESEHDRFLLPFFFPPKTQSHRGRCDEWLDSDLRHDARAPRWSEHHGQGGFHLQFQQVSEVFLRCSNFLR